VARSHFQEEERGGGQEALLPDPRAVPLLIPCTAASLARAPTHPPRGFRGLLLVHGRPSPFAWRRLALRPAARAPGLPITRQRGRLFSKSPMGNHTFGSSTTHLPTRPIRDHRARCISGPNRRARLPGEYRPRQLRPLRPRRPAAAFPGWIETIECCFHACGRARSSLHVTFSTLFFLRLSLTSAHYSIAKKQTGGGEGKEGADRPASQHGGRIPRIYRSNLAFHPHS